MSVSATVVLMVACRAVDLDGNTEAESVEKKVADTAVSKAGMSEYEMVALSDA